MLGHDCFNHFSVDSPRALSRDYINIIVVECSRWELHWKEVCSEMDLSSLGAKARALWKRM